MSKITGPLIKTFTIFVALFTLSIPIMPISGVFGVLAVEYEVNVIFDGYPDFNLSFKDNKK